MKVAVCDDQPSALDEVKRMLEQISFVREIHTFSDMDIFLSALKDGEAYDAVLMDIDWKKEKTGIDFAEEIEKQSPFSKIIYITAYTVEYVEDIFLKSSNLSGFLMKPVKMEPLERNLRKVKNSQEDRDARLVVRCKGSITSIPVTQIVYMESQLHKVRIILEEKEYEVNERLGDIRERLTPQFLSCHKSYVVNMDYISEFKNNEVILSSGKRIPVSKAKSSESKKRFFAYVSEKM